MKSICVDTGFLIGLYDERDQYHAKASDYFSQLFERSNNRMIVPWPIVYETFSTRMTKNRTAMVALERDWKEFARQNRLELLPDLPFRENVVEDCFGELRNPTGQYRRLSVVDRVIRRILEDVNVRIHAFVTFDPGHFRDVCNNVRRELLF